MTAELSFLSWLPGSQDREGALSERGLPTAPVKGPFYALPSLYLALAVCRRALKGTPLTRPYSPYDSRR